MSMSFSQQKRPRSGDHLRTNGLVALLTRKQTLIGPNVAPLANSWRVPGLQPRPPVPQPHAGPLPSINRKASRGAGAPGRRSCTLTLLLPPPPPPLLLVTPTP